MTERHSASELGVGEAARMVLSLVRGLLVGAITGGLVAVCAAPSWASIGFGYSTFIVTYAVLYFCEPRGDRS
jgi:hypothetical protein